MPLYYSVDYNHLTDDGKYFINIHSQSSVGETELAKAISEDSSFSVVDIKGMLMSFPEQAASILADGKNLVLQDLLGISVSGRLKNGVEITDPNYSLRSEDIDLRININPKAAFNQMLLNQLLGQKHPFIKQNPITAKPQISSVTDFKTQKKGRYSPNYTFGIYGAHFNHPKDLGQLPLDSGVFFQLADKSEQRATIYSLYKNEEIHCMVPSGVSGTVTVIVRQRSGNGLVEGSLSGLTEAA